MTEEMREAQEKDSKIDWTLWGIRMSRSPFAGMFPDLEEKWRKKLENAKKEMFPELFVRE